MQISELKDILSSFYSDTGPERVGLILEGNNIIEVRNISPKPEEGFLVSEEDIDKYIDTGLCVAVWHTHPNASCNLSGEDYRTFMQWKSLKHFIIGKDGVKCFGYDETRKAVMEVQ